MSPVDQNFLENLQASDHGRKRHLVFIGSFCAMVVVLLVWFSMTFFFSATPVGQTALVRPDFSLWKTVSGGSMLLAQNISYSIGSIGGFFQTKKDYLITPSAATN